MNSTHSSEPLREIVGVNIKSDRVFSPGIDAEITFKGFDSALEVLRLSIRITQEGDPPAFRLFVGGGRQDFMGNKNQVVSGVFFTINNPLQLGAALFDLGTALAASARHVEASLIPSERSA